MFKQKINLSDLDETDNIKKVETQPNQAIGPDGLPSIFHIPGEPVHHTEEEEFQITEEEEKKSEDSEQEFEPGLTPVKGFGTTMNLLNSLIGAGILSIPHTFTHCGLFTSIILLIAMGLLSWISTILVLSLKNKTGAVGFDDLVRRVLGKVGSVSFSVLNLIFLICAPIAYLILAVDMIISWLSLAKINASNSLTRSIIVFLYANIIPIPMTIPKNIRFLSYFSTVSLFSILFFVVSMVIKASIAIQNEGVEKSVSYGKVNINLFAALSIYSASFALPAVVIPIIRPYYVSIKKRRRITLIAMTIALILCSVSGISGYIIYGQKTNGNILKNFDDDDILIILVRSAFFFVVSFAYPAIAQAIMASWSDVIFHQNNQSALPSRKRFFIVFLTNIIPLLVAMLLSSAQAAIAIGGAIGGTFVCYIYPPIMAIVESGKPITSISNILCILFAFFGFITLCLSTYYAVVGAIQSFK